MVELICYFFINILIFAYFKQDIDFFSNSKKQKYIAYALILLFGVSFLITALLLCFYSFIKEIFSNDDREDY